MAIVWRPGQVTRIHDHVTWCVFGVIQGVEDEELFALDDGGECLVPVGRTATPPATSVGSPRPATSTASATQATHTAISIHVYGTDLSRIGSGVRRYYDLPVRPA